MDYLILTFVKSSSLDNRPENTSFFTMKPRDELRGQVSIFLYAVGAYPVHSGTLQLLTRTRHLSIVPMPRLHRSIVMDIGT